jgi:hypothetical protein
MPILLVRVPSPYIFVIVYCVLKQPIHSGCECYHSSRVGRVAALLEVRAVNHSMKPSVRSGAAFVASKWPTGPCNVTPLPYGCANII